jgi:hypothetical protein
MKISRITILIFSLILIKEVKLLKETTEETFNLHKEDIFSVKISDLISFQDLTNKLKVESTELKVTVPQAYEMLENEEFWEIGGKKKTEPGFKIEKVYSQSNFGDYFVTLVKTDQINNLLIISEVKREDKKLSIVSKISHIADDEYKCDKVVMEKDKVYTGCLSKLENNFYICEKYYKDDTQPVCEFYNFNYDFKNDSLEKETIKLELNLTPNNDVIILMYFKDTKIEYFENKFLLKVNEKSSLLSVPFEHKYQIRKIKIVNYEQVSNKVSCLISGVTYKPSKLTTLHHMNIINGIIDKEFLNKSLIYQNFKSFDQFNQDILIYEEIEGKEIKITEMNLENLTQISITLKNQFSLVRADMGYNKAIIETKNDKNQKEFFIYDTNSKRIIKSDIDIKEDERWSVMSLMEKNFFFVFDYETIKGRSYFLNSLRTVDVKNENNQTQGTVLFHYEDTLILKVMLKYHDFDYEDPSFLKNLNDLQSIQGRVNKIKIDYYMNDMKIQNQSIEYFNKIEIKDNKKSIEKCNPIRVFFDKNLFLYLCWDKKILLYNSVNFENHELILKDEIFYKTDPLFDFDLIKSIRFYYDKLFLILMNDMKIYWSDLSTQNTFKINVIDFHLSNVLFEKYDDCSWNNQGLICLKENQWEELSVEFKQDIIKVEPTNQISKNEINSKYNYFNSYFDRNYQITIKKDKYFNRLVLKGCKLACDLVVNTEFDFNETTKTHMITLNNYVFINYPQEGSFVINGLVNGSIIKYPTEGYIKEYKEFIGFNNFPSENMFVVFYRTIRNTIRALLYKATIDVNQRLIQEFVVDSEDCTNPRFFSHVFNYQQFLIYYFCEDLSNREYLWKYQMDGPLYISKGNETGDILLINGKELNLNFIYKNPKNDFNISASKMILGGSANGVITEDIEKSGKLNIEGDLILGKLKEKINGIELLQRTHYISTKDIPLLEEKVKEFPNLSSTFHQNQFILFLGDYIYWDNKFRDISPYKDCIFVEISYDSNKYQEKAKVQKFNNIFLCRGDIGFNYFLTDFAEIDIMIPAEFLEPNLIVQKALMIIIKEEIHLLASLSDSNKIIDVIKILENSKGHQKNPFDVVNSYLINLDNYFETTNFFSNFWATYDKEDSEIVLFFHPQYTSEIMIINFPLNENKISLRSKIVVSLHSNQELEIFKIKFFDLLDEDNITRIGIICTTNYHLYEINLEKEQEGEWEYKILNSFYNQSGNSKEDENISFNDHFVSLTLRKEKNLFNTLLWKKDDEKKHVHSSIGKFNLEEEDYKIANINMITMNDKDYTYVTYYYNKIGEKEWSGIKLKIFVSSNFQLKLDVDKLKYKELIKMKFISIDSQNVEAFIDLTLEENFRVFIFTITLIVLLILTFLLAILVVIIYKGNQKLKLDLERDLRENNITNNLA